MSAPEEPPVFPPERADDMLLRDWFAGQALAGMMAGNATIDMDDAHWRAAVAYLVADAMLLRRECQP